MNGVTNSLRSSSVVVTSVCITSALILLSQLTLSLVHKALSNEI